MAKQKVNAALIEKYLDRRGWTEHTTIPGIGEGEAVVGARWRTVWGKSLLVAISPISKKNVLLFQIGGIAHAKPNSTPNDRLSGLLMTIGYLNYKLLLGSWTFDPSDGELSFQVVIPTDSGDLDFETFEHCMIAALLCVESDGADLNAIIDGDKSASAVLKAEGATIG